MVNGDMIYIYIDSNTLIYKIKMTYFRFEYFKWFFLFTLLLPTTIEINK